jgi:translation initiation factor 2 subunit 2
MDEYENLLKRAQKSMPESVHEKSRFELPKVMGRVEGNKTIIINFVQIANHVHRDVNQMLKYVLKGLATPGEFRGTNLILGTKVPASRINEKIKQFCDTYVFCNDCGKPDTKLIKEGKILFLKCTACGSKHPVKGL